MPLYPETLNPLFDHIASHLASQRGQSLRSFGHGPRCAYRGKDGAQCAVGCLLTDSQYAEYGASSLEGQSANCLPWSLLEGLQKQYAPTADALHFKHALLVAQRYHDSEMHHEGQRYLDRLFQPELTPDGLQALILDDLIGHYITTPY